MSLLEKNTLKVSDSIDAPDVDVTPMMNILIILLPMLISMAVFTRIAMLSFSLPPNVGTGLNPANGKPNLKMTIVLSTQYVALTYGESMLDSIPISGTINDTQLKEKILSKRKMIANTKEAVLAVKDRVAFQNMVTVMDICKECGFEKIGVSSATENPGKGV